MTLRSFKFKRAFLLFLCAALLASALSACGKTEAPPTPSLPPISGGCAPLSAAVLYYGEADNGRWEDVYSRLDQSLLLNFTVEAIDAASSPDLSGYDLIYPDESVIALKDDGALRDRLTAFTESGGGLFLTNGFCGYFPAEFLGVREFIKLDACPTELQFPVVGADLSELQGIVADFASLYPTFPDYQVISQYDYGYGAVTSTATALVTAGKLALYTMNRVGEGCVFLTNPLLPNDFAVTGFSLTSRDERQKTLSNTTASCNQLLENGFAAYVSKQSCGFAVSRVFGCFGRPSMAWELHFEEITGFENGSGVLFGELCREYSEVPSYSLIRSTYEWFLRAESVSFLLGSKSADGVDYSMDFYENAYSSGTHVAAGGRWLSLARVGNAGSYFLDYPEYTQRAYPAAADMDGDGDLDLLCGSSDGYFHYYDGEGFSDRLLTAEGRLLTDAKGHPLHVESYSAPVLADVDGDGVTDFVSGSSDGRIYWFSGNGDLSFEYRGLLCGEIMQGQSLPEVGDLNGDGRLDLLCGGTGGRLDVCYGLSDNALVPGSASALALSPELGTWIAPRLADLNGDGVTDIAIGTAEGYIARFIADGAGFSADGFISLDEMNYKGNTNAKFGSNCVPFFADLNGDGVQDLLTGSLEYGLAYPIDSEYFPYRDELQSAVDYIRDNDFYLGAHFYTNQYASRERELYELRAQLDAMESYGIDTAQIGENHHTWYSSENSTAQSLLSAWDSGLLWNSGFMPAGNSFNAPQINDQNVISLPFFLLQNGERTMLLQNCSTLLYHDASKTDISAKYDMPMCMYYHCDFTFGNEDTARLNLQTADDFRRAHGYNFTGEDQLMLATAAAFNLNVSVRQDDAGFGFTLTPSAASDAFPLFDERYQASCGAKISLGEKLAGSALKVDASVWSREGDNIYVSLDRPVRVLAGEQGEAPHLCRVNIAARITPTDSGARVEFSDGGMMQLTVAGAAKTASDGWKAEERDGGTTFTKYGAADTIELIYGEG
ncbi:MAG: VCBS repeat-containing protein [Oscillospiraceae bacterium]